MGIKLSTDNSSEKIYCEIKETIKELIKDYEFWTDKDICNKLEIVYFDKLIKFRKNNLLDVSTAIGYKYDVDVDKNKLCREIIKHYKRRIELLKDIYDVLEKAKDRINRAQHGPVCKNVNSNVNNFIACREIPNSLWINEDEYKKVISNLKTLGIYEGWKKWLDKLEDVYFVALKKIYLIINKLKNDIDNSMSDRDFKALENYTRDLIKQFDTISDLYFLLCINYS